MPNPGDPTDLPGVAQGNWPADGSPGPAQDTARIVFTELAKRAQAFPASGAGFEGQIVLGKSDGTGATFAAAAGVAFIDCAGLPIVGNELGAVTITGSTGITGKLHRGRVLHYFGATSINLTINLDGTDNAGVSDGFHCVILRAYDNGATGQVHVVLGSGLTLQRADGLLGVAAGFPVGVAVLGGRLYLTGGVVA